MSCSTSKKMNTVVFDERVQGDILVGYCNLEGLQNSDYGIYYKKEFENYKANQSVLKQLKEKLDAYKIQIVLGTWCHDSKVQVPRFMRILDDINYKGDVEFICVDRKKEAPEIKVSELAIQRVPTFIIYKKKKEVGRIIETPKQTLEEDLLGIINQ